MRGSTIFTATLSVALLLVSQSGLRADPPAQPATPAASDPTVGVFSADPSDVQKVIQDALKGATGSSKINVFLTGQEALPDTRVSVDAKDEKVMDVLKDVLGQASLPFRNESAVPDKKVSIRLEKVKIGLALDAICDSGGFGWESGLREGKTTVVFTKEERPAGGRGYDAFSVLPQLEGSLGALNSSTNTRALARGLGAAPFTYTLRTRETRSTFTCPNCHNQITIVRKEVAPKCPTCGRLFEPGWKVCPFDGAKRPAEQDSWKFCPICGKQIPDGTISFENDNSRAGWDDTNMYSYSWDFGLPSK